MLVSFSILLPLFLTIVCILLSYLVFLGLLTIPSVQAHVLYGHKHISTVPENLESPERLGFLHKQATPFYISTHDDVILHAWHILPFNVYQQNYENLRDLVSQDSHIGSMSAQKFTHILNFRLLREDPQARLIISMHGNAGNLASGIRPLSYRVLSSAAPDIHALVFDYRGFGLSQGTPSEAGLLSDATTIFGWAVEVAGIPPERIVLFGHSLGAAVAIALAESLAPAVSCAGLVVVGSFIDVLSLTKTYRIKGVPLFKPVARIHYFTRHLYHMWSNKDRIMRWIRKSGQYHITFIHAENDWVIPATHANSLFRHAVTATDENAIAWEDLDRWKEEKKIELGEGGWFVEWPTKRGLIRQDMLKWGSHNPIVLNVVVQSAILRAFQARDHVVQL